MKYPNHVKQRAALERLRETGQPVPSLERMPVLHPHYRLYWTAWEELSEKRIRVGDDLNPIQYTEIEAYVRLKHITDEVEVDDICTYIPLLDSIWLQTVRKKIADQREKDRKKARSGARRPRRR